MHTVTEAVGGAGGSVAYGEGPGMAVVFQAVGCASSKESRGPRIRAIRLGSARTHLVTGARRSAGQPASLLPASACGPVPVGLTGSGVVMCSLVGVNASGSFRSAILRA